VNLGFVGLGKMGAVMAPRLLAAGHPVIAWNRSPEPIADLKRLGAQAASHPRAVVEGSEIIVTILSDDRAAEQVYHGEHGLFAGPAAGTLFVDMSTLRPDTMRALSARAEQLGGAFLDAPVLGTVAPAAKGQLVALVGGEAEDLERARPVLDILCRRVIHAGPQGQGALLKLAVNLLLGVYWQALGEAVAMGRSGGLSLDLMLEAIGSSGAALAALPLKTDAIEDPEGHVAFDVDAMLKDLSYIVETAQRQRVPAPAAAAALASYEAAAGRGWGKADSVAVVTRMAELVAAE
jgi:3-hydroxyisobutyrate dehydrogenase